MGREVQRHRQIRLIDIHATKGSQHGNDHSAPTSPGNIYWDGYQENIDNTVEVARFLAARYRTTPASLGVNVNVKHQ